ncbi:hypothetical protein MSSAC_2564 [Methanosarcina siciliae C2J]|uniref:Uncharacterized protein n=1 Tax=Methanosarcina siciliae C2J TaxID=1434118 RepID=A0A0E3PQ32_9EURY|nr:hypothetical protein [Methanosarcina siciliae]AKB37154.1 hypothetical protein MSSAC_2564 [Methanosarcina siciliae C2J]
MELKKTSAIALVTLLLITVMAPCCSCSSMALGANPKSLAETMERSSTTTLNVYVINYGTDSIDCILYVDEAYKPWVKLDPSSFTLNKSENRKVNVIITAPLEGEDINDFDLFIMGSSAELNGTPLNAGLKIPISISLTNPPDSPNGITDSSIWMNDSPTGINDSPNRINDSPTGINPPDGEDGNTSYTEILVNIVLLLLIIILLLIIVLLWKQIQR